MVAPLTVPLVEEIFMAHPSSRKGSEHLMTLTPREVHAILRGLYLLERRYETAEEGSLLKDVMNLRGKLRASYPEVPRIRSRWHQAGDAVVMEDGLGILTCTCESRGPCAHTAQVQQKVGE